MYVTLSNNIKKYKLTFSYKAGRITKIMSTKKQL